MMVRLPTCKLIICNIGNNLAVTNMTMVRNFEVDYLTNSVQTKTFSIYVTDVLKSIKFKSKKKVKSKSIPVTGCEGP
jgi:hypothetical protein